MSKPEVSCAVLMCHAPIVIPVVAGEQADACLISTEGMRSAARALVASRPQTVVVLSPHTPRHSSAFGIVCNETLFGTFQPFGVARLRYQFANDLVFCRQLLEFARQSSCRVELTEIDALDHGALVPLYFLQEAGYAGKIVVVSFLWESSSKWNREMGLVLRQTIEATQGNVALLASGDMSHRLIPAAPAGFHPRAQEFDRQVVEVVRSGRYSDVSFIPPDLRHCAAEDVIDSLEIASAVLGEGAIGHQFISYEGPFGVGYLTAILKREKGALP